MLSKTRLLRISRVALAITPRSVPAISASIRAVCPRGIPAAARIAPLQYISARVGAACAKRNAFLCAEHAFIYRKSHERESAARQTHDPEGDHWHRRFASRPATLVAAQVTASIHAYERTKGRGIMTVPETEL